MTLFLIFVYLALGFFAQKLPIRAPYMALILNRYVLWWALPAVTLLHITPLQLHWGLLLPTSVAWIVFGLAWIWVIFLQRRFGWDRATTGCLLLTCGLANTSFVGFPMIRWLYGEQALETAVLIDQPGTFLVLSTLGLIGAGFYAGQRPQARTIVHKIVTFPPFIAFLVALTLNRTGITFTGPWEAGLRALSSTLTPAALLAVGLQLQLGTLRALRAPLAWGLAFRLGLSPLLIWGLYQGALGLRGETLGVSVLEAGMAPMITGAIVAANLGLNPALAGLMVSLGISASLVSVPLWYWVLQSCSST